jgi:hypothetical protein
MGLRSERLSGSRGRGSRPSSSAAGRRPISCSPAADHEHPADGQHQGDSGGPGRRQRDSEPGPTLLSPGVGHALEDRGAPVGGAGRAPPPTDDHAMTRRAGCIAERGRGMGPVTTSSGPCGVIDSITPRDGISSYSPPPRPSTRWCSCHRLPPGTPSQRAVHASNPRPLGGAVSMNVRSVRRS